jgi:hypothetical protein
MPSDGPMDRRIREGLNRTAEGMELDPLVLLRDATGRGNRVLRRRRQLVVLGGITAIVVLAALVMLPLTQRDHTPVQLAEPRHASRLSGSFTRTVTGTAGAVQTGHLAGPWTLQFVGGGTARVQAPQTFQGIRSGVSFLQNGDRVRIDIFAQDLCAAQPVGSYRWTDTGDRLRFTNVNDTCKARIGLLTGGSWLRVS